MTKQQHSRPPLNLYLVYPDYWQESKWGKPPLLGRVYADSAFTAERRAYDRGLLPVNFTFGPKVVPAKVTKKLE